MKKKVKVKSDWGFRVFIIQALSVIISIFLITLKLFTDLNITWLETFYPIILSVGIPTVLLILSLGSTLLLFTFVYIFKGKDKRVLMKKSFKNIISRVNE